MALSSLANYRNLLLATNAYKNEGVARFFGYTGHNGRVLEAKECFVFQDSFVHPQGVLARTALLRDVANNNVKYGSGDIQFYSTSVAKNVAGTTLTATAPGRILGVYVDNLNKAVGQVVNVTTDLPGSDTTIFSAAQTIPTSETSEALDFTSALKGHAGSAYVSGAMTVSAPAALTLAVPASATDTITPASTAGVPFVAGDQVTLTSVINNGGIANNSTYFVGAITNTNFKLYTTLAGALAGGATNLVDITGTDGTCTVTAALRADGGSATAAINFVAESGSSISANNGKPVRFSIANGGCGYNAAPGTFTYPSGAGSGIIARTHFSNGRINAVDVHHACDVLPGTQIKFPILANDGTSATGAAFRITVAIANFSV